MKYSLKKWIRKGTGLLLAAGLLLSEPASLLADVRQGTEAASGAMTVGEVPSYHAYQNGSAADYAALYDAGMEITSSEAVSVRNEAPTDLSALGSFSDGAALTSAVKAFEAKKALFLLDRLTGDAVSSAALPAWNRQKDLNQFYYGYETSEVAALIPSVSVLEAKQQEDAYRLRLSEWMTVGYSDRAVSDVINFTAYRLEFTMTLAASDLTVKQVVNDDTLFAEMDENTEEITAVNEKEAGSTGLNQFNEAICSRNGLPAYNPAGAIAYAQQWATARNPAFSDYTGRGGDCANFVSQCLMAGGMPTDGTWYKDSKAWIAVIAMSNWLCGTYGVPRLVADNSNVLPGSPVCYQWHSNWQASFKPNHVTICTGYNAQGVPVVCGHTRDIRDVAWHYGYGDTTYMTMPLGSGGSSSPSPAVSGLPQGYLDQVTGKVGQVKVKGWAFDPDHPEDPVTVQIYMDGPAGQGTMIAELTADKKRSDLKAAGFGKNVYHGFSKTITLKKSGTHTFYACAVDLDDGNQTANLNDSPKSAKIISPYSIKIPTIKVKAGKTKVYKITFAGIDWADVDWVVGNEDVAVAELDSSADEPKMVSGRKKSWVKIAVTGEKKGSTKLTFRILDEDGTVLYKKKAKITVTKPKKKKKKS